MKFSARAYYLIPSATIWPTQGLSGETPRTAPFLRSQVSPLRVLSTFWFYKKGCQEKKLPRELEAAKSFGIQPPSRGAGASRRRREWSGCETARCLDARAINFPTLLSLILGRGIQNGPERSRARPIGAAQRTLDGEDRSETVYEEGKEELQLDSISEAQQAKRLPVHVATIVLSETRGL